MTVQEIMERVGIKETGKALAYIKDALEEINIISDTHLNSLRVVLKKNQRFYNIPNEALKIIEVRCKNHLNSKDEYKSIPRAIGAPINQDND